MLGLLFSCIMQAFLAICDRQPKKLDVLMTVIRELSALCWWSVMSDCKTLCKKPVGMKPVGMLVVVGQHL